MNIYSNSPYTYFLMWSNTKMKYYGCQHGKNANPQNILTHKYKTSSKYTKQHWKEFGPPDIIVIHRTFVSKEECLIFEHEYLKRVGAVKKDDWLNKTDNRAISTDTYSQDSWKCSHESRRLHMDSDLTFKKSMAERFVKNMQSESASAKRSKTFNDIGHSKGEKNPRYGVKIKGTELATKISSARKLQIELNKQNAEKLNAKKYVCEHCNTGNLSAGNYKRWHHLNCRHKVILK